MARAAESLVLVALTAERLHQSHAAHDFLEHAGRLAEILARLDDSRGAELEHRLERKRKDRRDDERQQREPRSSRGARRSSRRCGAVLHVRVTNSVTSALVWSVSDRIFEMTCPAFVRWK